MLKFKFTVLDGVNALLELPELPIAGGVADLPNDGDGVVPKGACKGCGLLNDVVAPAVVPTLPTDVPKENPFVPLPAPIKGLGLAPGTLRGAACGAALGTDVVFPVPNLKAKSVVLGLVLFPVVPTQELPAA